MKLPKHVVVGGEKKKEKLAKKKTVNKKLKVTAIASFVHVAPKSSNFIFQDFFRSETKNRSPQKPQSTAARRVIPSQVEAPELERRVLSD